MGDSKTNSASATWVNALKAVLNAGTPGGDWQFKNFAFSGENASDGALAITSRLVQVPATYDVHAVVINWGANGVATLPAQATLEANYATVLDAVHSKWPTAEIYVTKPWRRGYDSNCATYASWIDNVLATRPWVTVSDDEAVWMKGADDGATMSYDGIHNNAAGNTEKLNQMRTALGY